MSLEGGFLLGSLGSVAGCKVVGPSSSSSVVGVNAGIFVGLVG